MVQNNNNNGIKSGNISQEDYDSANLIASNLKGNFTDAKISEIMTIKYDNAIKNYSKDEIINSDGYLDDSKINNFQKTCAVISLGDAIIVPRYYDILREVGIKITAKSTDGEIVSDNLDVDYLMVYNLDDLYDMTGHIKAESDIPAIDKLVIVDYDISEDEYIILDIEDSTSPMVSVFLGNYVTNALNNMLNIMRNS